MLCSSKWSSTVLKNQDSWNKFFRKLEVTLPKTWKDSLIKSNCASREKRRRFYCSETLKRIVISLWYFLGKLREGHKVNYKNCLRKLEKFLWNTWRASLENSKSFYGLLSFERSFEKLREVIWKTRWDAAENSKRFFKKPKYIRIEKLEETLRKTWSDCLGNLKRF